MINEEEKARQERFHQRAIELVSGKSNEELVEIVYKNLWENWTRRKKFNDSKRETELFRTCANVGLTVELVGHDFERDMQYIGEYLESRLKETTTKYLQRHTKFIKETFDNHVEQFRTMYPMSICRQYYTQFSGKDVETFLLNIFQNFITRDNYEVTFTESFQKYKWNTRQNLIYPVFSNILNNALYWSAQTSEDTKKIKFDCLENESIIITDNGPGALEEDVPKLFSLLFSRRARGGKGIGLYLCKENIKLTQYDLEYSTNHPEGFGGATFVISKKVSTND
jgi:light-regulated signal transduction histidine kinase (bacteriophytochrome)